MHVMFFTCVLIKRLYVGTVKTAMRASTQEITGICFGYEWGGEYGGLWGMYVSKIFI